MYLFVMYSEVLAFATSDNHTNFLDAQLGLTQIRVTRVEGRAVTGTS